MIILDTNVISELMRPKPAAQVFAWVDAQERNSLYTTTIVQAEILRGVANLDAGKRKDALLTQTQTIFREDFENRILPFTSDAAEHFAAFTANRQRQGKTVSYFDALIAACALCIDAAIATRDVKAFEGCGITIYNPWED